MKSKYYWLMGLGGVMSVVLVSGLANAHWNRTLVSDNTNAQSTPETAALSLPADIISKPDFLALIASVDHVVTY